MRGEALPGEQLRGRAASGAGERDGGCGPAESLGEFLHDDVEVAVPHRHVAVLTGQRRVHRGAARGAQDQRREAAGLGGEQRERVERDDGHPARERDRVDVGDPGTHGGEVAGPDVHGEPVEVGDACAPGVADDPAGQHPDVDEAGVTAVRARPGEHAVVVERRRAASVDRARRSRRRG